MIKELKRNETDYVRKCSKCGGRFTYNRSDYFSSGYNNNYVRCPYCGNRQQFLFHKVYKSNEEKQKDYKKMLEEVQQEKLKLNNTIGDLQYKIDRLKEEKAKIESNAESKIIRLKNDIDRLEKENLRITNRAKSYQEDFDRVCEQNMGLEDELESLKSTIDKLGIVIKEDVKTDLVEPIDEVGDVPKKKKTKKKVEEIAEEK